MKIIFYRVTGMLLIAAAILGLVFSIAGLFGVWKYKPAITENLINAIDLLSDTIDTTQDGLVVTHESLDGVLASMRSLQSTTETTAKTIQSVEPAVDEIAILLGEDLPKTVQAAQESLNTAQDSAKVIESVLKALDFLPGIEYKPETSLDNALGDISESVDNLPNSLINMEDSLDNASHNLQVLRVDLALMVDSIRQIESSISQYDQVLEGYHSSLEQVQDQLNNLADKAPAIIELISWGLTLFLVWMAIAQLGLLTQGTELLFRQDIEETNALDPYKEFEV